MKLPSATGDYRRAPSPLGAGEFKCGSSCNALALTRSPWSSSEQSRDLPAASEFPREYGIKYFVTDSRTTWEVRLLDGRLGVRGEAETK